MKYGLPYQGSKNRLAERIVGVLPSAKHLYDVFAGGCAITHAALLSGKWGCVHFSDINDSVELFRDCIEGGIPDGSEWISREEFERRKHTDAFVRILWSFGNNQMDYLYSRDIEPYKKAVHEMLYAPTPNERRLKFREVCKLIPSVLENKTLRGGYNDASQRKDTGGSVPPSTHRTRITPPNVKIRPLCDLQSNEAYNRIGRIAEAPFCGGEYEMKVADYRDVEILPDSIVYADIPYVSTTGYNEKVNTFDHEAFYDWAERQTVPVFISEYWMPDERFTAIAEWPRTSSFAKDNNALKVIEKLFVPNKWKDDFCAPTQRSLNI